ncbi:THO complex subunit 4D-like protein [Tanacetum coccineum]
MLLKSTSPPFNRGFSRCSAEVLFARRSDAFQVLKRYNSVQLDGRPMRIEIEGSKSEIPIFARVNVARGLNGQRTVVMRFLALGWHLEEIHVTWAHLEKKRTRLRLYTKNHEELCIQRVETASPS